MHADRLTELLHAAYLDAGFEVQGSSDTEHLFSVKSAADHSDIMPYVFMRCLRSRVLVFGMADIGAILSKHRCEPEDLAYAMSEAVVGMGGTEVRVEIRQGAVALHKMVKSGVFFSARRMYVRTYDAMIEIWVAMASIEDSIKRCVWRRGLGVSDSQ
jgi:hypothetical protein